MGIILSQFYYNMEIILTRRQINASELFKLAKKE